MAKIIAVFVFLLIGSCNLYAATISYQAKSDSIDFVITFQNRPSNITMLKGDKNIVFNFETSEGLDFKRQDFFDLPIKSAYVTGTDSFRKKFIVTFDKNVIDPKVNASNKTVLISFPISPELLSSTNQQDNFSVTTPKPSVAGIGTYLRMLMGLIIVLIIILGLYWLLKSYLKKKVFSDIPGSGRLLGKVDLEIRKSLYFYEIGDTIYIIGVTDSSMSLIDKISDDTEMSKIKAGLAKKHEFTGYMTFFGRKNQKGGLNEDISAGNTLVEEKIKSLRRK